MTEIVDSHLSAKLHVAGELISRKWKEIDSKSVFRAGLLICVDEHDRPRAIAVHSPNHIKSSKNRFFLNNPNQIGYHHVFVLLLPDSKQEYFVVDLDVVAFTKRWEQEYSEQDPDTPGIKVEWLARYWQAWSKLDEVARNELTYEKV